jgi:hypothetical protein
LLFISPNFNFHLFACCDPGPGVNDNDDMSIFFVIVLQVNFGRDISDRIRSNKTEDVDGSETVVLVISGFPGGVSLNTPSNNAEAVQNISSDANTPDSVTIQGTMEGVDNITRNFRLFVNDRDSDAKFNLSVAFTFTDTNGETGPSALTVSTTYTLIQHGEFSFSSVFAIHVTLLCLGTGNLI